MVRNCFEAAVANVNKQLKKFKEKRTSRAMKEVVLPVVKDKYNLTLDPAVLGLIEEHCTNKNSHKQALKKQAKARKDMVSSSVHKNVIQRRNAAARAARHRKNFLNDRKKFGNAHESGVLLVKSDVLLLAKSGSKGA